MVAHLHKKSSRKRTKLLAFCNIIGIVYFVIMTFVTASLALWEIKPKVVRNDDILLAIWDFIVLFLLINVSGNAFIVYKAENNLGNGNEQGEWRHLAEKSKLMCRKCTLRVPARCHHCILCDCCIVKRDHHCFFLCSCIGLNNQSNFVIFCFYLSNASFYASLFTIYHAHTEYNFNAQYAKDIMISSLRKIIFHNELVYYDPFMIFLVAVSFGAFCGGVAAVGFLFWQLKIICRGQTTQEYRKGITTFCSRHKWKNLRNVFGPYWFLSLIIPIKSSPPSVQASHA